MCICKTNLHCDLWKCTVFFCFIAFLMNGKEVCKASAVCWSPVWCCWAVPAVCFFVCCTNVESYESADTLYNLFCILQWFCVNYNLIQLGNSFLARLIIAVFAFISLFSMFSHFTTNILLKKLQKKFNIRYEVEKLWELYVPLKDNKKSGLHWSRGLQQHKRSCST